MLALKANIYVRHLFREVKCISAICDDLLTRCLSDAQSFKCVIALNMQSPMSGSPSVRVR